MTTRRRSILVCALVVAWLGLPAVASAQEAPVRLEEVFQVNTSIGPLYRVSYQYAFAGLDTIAVSDLGSVPASGKLTYLTSLETIEFRDPRTNALLHSASLKDATKVMSARRLAMPNAEDFPEAATFGFWKRKEDFAGRALQVLNEFFDLGVRPYPQGKEQFIVTTYRQLDPMPQRLQAEVAVMVRFSMQSPQPLRFAVHLTARERRSHSDWQEELSKETVTAIGAFRARLLSRLEGRP